MIKLKMIFLVGFLLLAVVSIFNQTKVCNAVDNLIEFPGQTESVGTYFEIKDSEYLNLILESSEEVRVILESIPKMISLNIDNINDDIGFTNLVLVGLEPNKTYYKYEDSYKNLVVFVADGDGIYSWTQEINQPHHVWIQEIKSTIFLPEDCSVYGDWNEALSTCTLNRNLYETVEITRDDIILDCDDYSIIGPDSAYGLYLWDRSGVVIISCNINNFSIGINLYRSNNNKFIDNNVSENWNGFNIYNSDSNVLINNIISSNRNSGVRNSSSFNNTFTGNIISNNLDTGILNHSSFNNTFTENIISNSYLGIYHYLSSHSTFTGNIMFDSRSNFDIFGTDVSHYTNYADTSNLVDGKPIYYLLSAEDQIFDSSTNAGLFLCIGCNNITIKDLTFSKNRCSIFFWDTHNSKIENIITLNTYCGINFEHSTNNIITNNTFSGVVNDKSFGVRLSRYSNNNIIVDNTFSNHYYGISIDDSVDNKVYHNNFIDNSRSSVSCGEAGNFFDNDHLDGGNYWDDYDESLEGCKDADNNGICDDPYVFEYGIGQDNYPFMNENGWEVSEPVCGNGIQEEGETFENCYQDCAEEGIEKYFPYYKFSLGEEYYPVSFYFDNDADVENNRENYISEDSGNSYKPYVYAHTVEDDNYFTIQYWKYEVFNEHRILLNHNHDWDATVFVVFKKNDLSQPTEVRFARHIYIGVYAWDEVEKRNTTHPVVYVAKGSHGGYISQNMGSLDVFDDGGITHSPDIFNYYRVGYCSEIINKEISGEQREFCLVKNKLLKGEAQNETADGYWPNLFEGNFISPEAPWNPEKDKWNQTRPEGAWSVLEFGVDCPVDLHIYDSEGRHVGINYGTNELEVEIPEAIFRQEGEKQYIMIPNPMKGDYRVEIIGTDNGEYDFAMLASEDMKLIETQEKKNVSIAKDEVQTFTIIGLWESPREMKEKAIVDLELIESNNKIIQKNIQEAIDLINESLNEKYWLDDLHLDLEEGKKVFDYELKAITRLKLLENLNKKLNLNDDQLLDIIKIVSKKLTKADYLLAETILNETKEMEVGDNSFKKIIEKFIAKAEKELVEAKEDLENNEPAKSIIHSKKSWHYVQQAIKSIERFNN